MSILKPTLEVLAEHLMFSSNRSTQSFLDLMESQGVEFRKNKNIEDINKAMHKAQLLKNGHGKIELEQNMLECYIGDILKEKVKTRRV